MSSSILHPPAHLSPAVALELAQQAPLILANAPSSSFLGSFLGSETADLWTSYENLMISCLRTGDEASARLCVERLTARFGADNERVLALQGLFKEATAADDKELQVVLKEYNRILDEDGTNVPVSKRRIALLKSLGKTSEAIAALNKFLESFPTDAEAWAELSDLYLEEGLYPQAIFALEEVLLVTPNAWNIHAKLGELLYMAAATAGNDTDKYLAEAVRRFCRSIELCDDYLRGYYGLKLTTNLLLKSGPQNSRHSKQDDAALPLPDRATLEKLNEKATEKLAEIIRRAGSGEAGWTGYDEAELIAARELLDRDTAPVQR